MYRKLSHAQLAGVDRWTICSDVLKYEMESLEIATVPLLAKLVKSGIRWRSRCSCPTHMSKDTGERICNGAGTKHNCSLQKTWFQMQGPVHGIIHTFILFFSQVAGWTPVYGDILSFATIRGASHEAPLSQPKRSVVVFNAFLEGTQLPLPQAL
ncbi:hypothetical protein SADUNF_Sadunf16G0031100 [Salix dunnii]|uniref:Uncharacterized protein n=1 Tax=Salix dunnii TaxID=1413687 RepID=A0A835J6Q5_9ROSI|nr:hypothetical protein SADUNF_Sadunf16G0031100 [Salix dunnii]